MKCLKFAAVLAFTLLLASTASAEVQLTIQNGRVSLKAKDATLRQIMQEWARVGQTKAVNVERIPGGPITLELTNVTEAEALEVLLRTVSGYVAAPRATAVANNLSRFDRIVVMPAAAAPKQALSAAPPTPAFQQPQMAQPIVDDDPDDAPAGARPPIFGAFPQPQVINPGQPGMQQNPNMPPGFVPPNGYVPPQQQGQAPQQNTPSNTFGNTPSNTFGAPSGGIGGVAVPGMMVPVPQQPGQPGVVQPGSPTQPGGR